MTAAWTGLVLALGVAQLLPRHLGILALLASAQGLAAAAGLAARGTDPVVLGAAAVSALLAGGAVPFLIWRLAEGRAVLPPTGRATAGMAMGVLALALALAVPSGVLGPALGVVLAGLLLIAVRPDPLAGVVGLAGIQAGVMLVLAALPTLPLTALPAAAVPLPAGLLLARLWRATP